MSKSGRKQRQYEPDEANEPQATYEAAHAFGASAHETGEGTKRKNFYLYQSKIDMAKELLGASTETEAIDGALDLLIYGEALARGTAAMAGEEYHDVLGIADEIPER